MTAEPKVSVCVITYNHGAWLGECLQSIVDQVTNFQVEIIVGDDCSTDSHTREILREFSSRHPEKIVPLFREKNLGGHGTQNWLDVMRRARGEYVAHIDGDDRMLPGKLQKQADYLDSHGACAFVAHDLRAFDSLTGATLPTVFAGKPVPENSDIEYLLINRCFFGHSSKMFRRNATITQVRDKPTVDFFMHVEHASTGSIGYIREALGEYRRSAISATNISSVGFAAIIEGYEDAFNRASELGVDTSIVEMGRRRFHYSLAMQFLGSGEHELFKKHIRLTFKNWRRASHKHRLLALLSCYPRIARILQSAGRK